MRKSDKEEKPSRLGEIKTPQQYFRRLKQHLMTLEPKCINVRQLVFRPYGPQSLLDPFVSYFRDKYDVTSALREEGIQKILKKMLVESKMPAQSFSFKDNFIYYNYKIKFHDQQSFLNQINLHPEGVLVDDEFLKYGTGAGDVKKILEQAIKSRQIIAVKSKFYDKSKSKDDNFLGYYLFPFPPELKIFRKQLLKNSSGQQQKQDMKFSNQKDKQYQKVKKMYETKTFRFRSEFQNACSENANKAQQEKSGKNDALQNFSGVHKEWDIINKECIPNFQRQVEQWCKVNKVDVKK